MKILAISNLYPPHYIGGYELACAEVMDGLVDRGHDVQVLTSRFALPDAPDAGANIRIDRISPYDSMPMFFPARPWGVSSREILDEARIEYQVRQIIKQFQPDLISAWNLGGISLSVISCCLESGVPVALAISDYWLKNYFDHGLPQWYVYWSDQSGMPIKRGVKNVVKAVVGRHLARTGIDLKSLKYAHFYSDYLRRSYSQSGFDVKDGVVIRHGVDLNRYPFRDGTRPGVVKLLYVGRLDPMKGVDVPIRALSILKRRDHHEALELHIYGAGPKDYTDELIALTESEGLSGKVFLHGRVAREETARLYGTHDVLVFPSRWPEPFSVALIEAMACGIPVVSTATGGTPEILRHGQNSLIFKTDDADDLADKLLSLAEQRNSGEDLRRRARKDVESNCNIHHIIDKIDNYYTSIFTARNVS